MKVVKIILSILSFLVSTALATALVWGLLYLCIPSVKDNTDKIFNKNDTQIEEEKKDDSIETQQSCKVDFENKVIKLKV